MSDYPAFRAVCGDCYTTIDLTDPVAHTCPDNDDNNEYEDYA